MIARSFLPGLALALALAAGPASAARLEIESPHVDVGAAVVFTTIEHRFTVRNTGSTPVALTRWFSPSGVGEVVDLPATLGPAQAAEFRVRIPLEGEPGKFARRFAIFTDEADVDRYRFSVSGFAYGLLSPDAPVLTFGDVTRGKKETLSVDLSAQEKQALRLVEVVEQPAWADTRIDGTRVEVTINEKLPAGPNGAKVRIRTNLAAQPVAEIGLVANGRGGLEASEYFLLFPLEQGATARRSLRFTHPSADLGRELEVRAEPGWKTSKRACAAASPHCIEVVLERKVDFTGRKNGKFGFHLDAKEHLDIGYSILGLAEGQRVRELTIDSGAEGQASAADLDRALAGLREPAATRATDAATPPAPTAPINGRGPAPVRLVWRARKMDQTFGFLVYRATSRRGPFVRVSSPVVAGADGGFEFVDAEVETGSTYYYYVDALATNGKKMRFSPVMSKTITAE